MLKIYHNNRCTKSRNVLQILQQEKRLTEKKLYLHHLIPVAGTKKQVH